MDLHIQIISFTTKLTLQYRDEIIFFCVYGIGTIWVKKQWILTHMFYHIQESILNDCRPEGNR